MTLVWIILLLGMVGRQANAVYGTTGRRAPEPTLYTGLVIAAPFVVLAAASRGNTELWWAGALIAFAGGTVIGELVSVLRRTKAAPGRRVALGVGVTAHDYLPRMNLTTMRAAPAVVVVVGVGTVLLVRWPAHHTDSGLSVALPVAIGASAVAVIGWICAELGVRAVVGHPLRADTPEDLRAANRARARYLVRFTNLVPAYAVVAVVLWLAYAADALLKANSAPYPADAQLAGYAILVLCGAAASALAVGLVVSARAEKDGTHGPRGALSR
ncbi:hypothetical protein [Tsukamurella paurometabola]|uniref:Uncharacterized protein n=1 Tax=Tsukamurella paurometabola TaxID=2061 RepID=A0ABS5NCM5_TSUPA|nr:hypothetical protein [Tsukamurella paurometabola]MBS4102006.1 hypothetical protein [Tsukamurella paurometabola]